MATKLVFIRHGITEWNKQKRYCGCKDIGLSSQGKVQAVKLRNRFKGFKFDKIYSSDKRRALQTSRILFGKAIVIKAKGLREINFGVLEGLRHKEIMEKYSRHYKGWLADPYKGRIPKAESIAVFKRRVESSINDIIRLNRGKTVAIVCHGGVIGIFVSSILKSRDFWGYVPSAASVTTVEHKNNKLKLRKFNDKTHLS